MSEKSYEKEQRDLRRQESMDEDAVTYQVSYEVRER